MSSQRWFSVHTHCTYSYGDGTFSPAEHAARLVELGYAGAAITDHGNTTAHAPWEKAMRAAGLHPAFGCELYTGPPKELSKCHQTVVAENLTGYRNLCRLVSRSWREGFYRWPTCHSDMLEDHCEGLISTSGCADSLLACTLLGGKFRGPERDTVRDSDLAEAKRVISWFKDLYGDGYYLEVQRFPELARTRTLNRVYAELGAALRVPLVATADVHYLHPHQNKLQATLHAARRGKSTAVIEAEWEYNVLLSYPLSDKEIWKQLVATGLNNKQAWAAIHNAEEIGQRCQVELPKTEPPRYPGTRAEMNW